MSKKKINHIELFAGCGGMSLGLESAGYDLYFANELSPMAGETFAFNLLNENIQNSLKKTYWINSKYSQDELNLRLRESPFDAIKGKFKDLNSNIDLEGKLLLGDVNELLKFLNETPDVVERIKQSGIDLLSGGPPCQSFSLAGRREKNNHKNTLPSSFAKIAGLIQPKSILLENVKGITAPFNEEGKKYYAWLEVSKAFALEGFVPVCMMLNSKYFGVAQNRPRFILIAYRIDLFNDILDKSSSKKEILKKSLDFYNKVNDNKDSLETISLKDLNYYDIEENPELFNGNVFPKISHSKEEFISAEEAIEDIRNTEKTYKLSDIKGKYSNTLKEIFPKKRDSKHNLLSNHEPRNHSYDVMARFRFYQVISKFQNGMKKNATDLLKGKEVENCYQEKLLKEFSKETLYFKEDQGEYRKPTNQLEVKELIETIPSKKHSQRALIRSEPAPAQLTIPDDLCHYHKDNLRTMTVREMARFQSFPDWFEFRSKVTTGGKMRKFEVPQYTQVGNAVPPLLAKALGEALKKQFL